MTTVRSTVPSVTSLSIDICSCLGKVNNCVHSIKYQACLKISVSISVLCNCNSFYSPHPLLHKRGHGFLGIFLNHSSWGQVTTLSGGLTNLFMWGISYGLLVFHPFSFPWEDNELGTGINRDGGTVV